MTGDKLAIGAVAALAALSIAKQRGSRSNQLSLGLQQKTRMQNVIVRVEGKKYGGRLIYQKTGDPKLDEAIANVLSQLNPSILKPPFKKMHRDRVKGCNRLTGHCFVATESMWELLKQLDGYDYVPCQIRVYDDGRTAPKGEGGSHWFLKSLSTKHVIDLTAGQFSGPVDYGAGVCDTPTLTYASRYMMRRGRPTMRTMRVMRQLDEAGYPVASGVIGSYQAGSGDRNQLTFGMERGADIYPGHNIDGATKGAKLPGADKGKPVQVYFNLNAQQYLMYGAIRPIRSDLEHEFEAHHDQIEEYNRERGNKCRKTNPSVEKIRNEYQSGPIYSIKQGRVVGLARALVIQNVVFTTSASTIKGIREKGSKSPCCYGNGYLIETGHKSYDRLEQLKQQYGDPVQVAFIPNNFSTFVTFTKTGPKPVFTAEYVVFAGNDRPEPGRKPAKVYAFGVNKPSHRQWYKQSSVAHTTACQSLPIEGVSVTSKRPKP